MNATLVQELFRDIQQKNTGVQLIKADLHVHTPASFDFVCGEYSADDAYYALLDEAINEEIRVIAITDHNTFRGVNKIRELMRASKKYRELVVLCGIEITCFSKHLVAIFPDTFLKSQQDAFLTEIGISEELQGTEEAVADNYGPAVLLEKIGRHGGFGILAHADAEKGFLQSLCINNKNDKKVKEAEAFSYSGKSLAKIIKSPFLFGVQCNNDYNKSILNEKLQNHDYARTDRALAFIKCSDCHGISKGGKYFGKSGHPMGGFYSEFKLSELSFESIKMALLDADMRMFSGGEPEYPYIYGVAIKSPILSSGDEFITLRFNSELNCIIGSRGTGKTTILETIQSTIMPNSIKGTHRFRVYRRYSSCVVFIKNGQSMYAVTNEPKLQVESYTGKKDYVDKLRIYAKEENTDKYRNISGENVSFINDFLASGYQQRQLYEYSKNPDKIIEIIDGFIVWKYSAQYSKAANQIDHMEKKLDELLLSIRDKRVKQGDDFLTYVREKGLEKQICKYISLRNKATASLSDLRKGMMDELNSVLARKVILELYMVIREKAWREDVDYLANKVKKATSNTYEYYLKIKKALEKVYALSPYAGSFDFYLLLLSGQYEKIRQDYKLNLTNDDMERILSQINEDYIKASLADGLKMRYNVNTGTDYSEKYKDNSQISMGQNAVALLLLILNAAYNMNDNRPLLMDQPEDDLDNSYIYSTLVKEFRTSKEKRQIIISTHNPNIPVAADAESVLVLEFNGDHGVLANVGSIDSNKTANYILKIMEGGEEAIKRRMEKYNVRYESKNCP